jgi:hypothetical protein
MKKANFWHNMTVMIVLQKVGNMHFHGFVVRFEFGSNEKNFLFLGSNDLGQLHRL